MSELVDAVMLDEESIVLEIGAVCLFGADGRISPLVRIRDMPREAYLTPAQARSMVERLTNFAQESEVYATTLRGQPGAEVLATLEMKGNA